ncbi:MAG: U32 family peptidase [Muribaculaceae bacterium]|nr:U32 family peptidase [Muribaculaceae bacterium]
MTDKSSTPRSLELLSPARDLATAIAAIDCGADAVYIGGPDHGARAAASNSIEDICKLVEYAHPFGVKVYVTLNTLVYENEIDGVKRLVKDLYNVGVDALIVQDMSLLEMDIPPIELHASTQCDTRTPEKALRLQTAGFSQIVVARELNLDEIKSIADAVDVPIEVFVHGALCVSYSGDCRASLLATGRSANRGECAQMCRLPYDLTDSSGRVIVAGRHFLSLKDMNRLDNLEQLIDAGASSFKIEGRLKDVGYVKNITALYSARLDEIIRRNPDKYRRSSFGVKTIDFTPSAESVFNRGFTNYFLSRPEPHSLASIATPKSTGRVVGRVKNVHNNCVTLDKSLSIENGDGLGYFDRDGQFNGFRANRVEGNKVFTRDKAPAIAPGTEIYCNSDRQSRLISQRGTTPRRLSTSINLRRVDKHRIVISMTTESGASAEVVADVEFQTARSPQRENRHRIITKLGDTIFIAGEIDDTLADDDFTAASVLTDLRRRCCEMLMTSVKSRYKTAVRRAAKQLSTPETVDFHENISNSLARKFYTDHGTQKIDDALEVQKPVNKEVEVMKCRYCLRRELGACLKTPNRNKLPNDLMLRQVGGNRRYRLEFDCKNCQMTVIDVTASK